MSTQMDKDLVDLAWIKSAKAHRNKNILIGYIFIGAKALLVDRQHHYKKYPQNFQLFQSKASRNTNILKTCIFIGVKALLMDRQHHY